MATAKHKRTGNINKKQTLIRIMQINLQHSRTATDNLMKLTQQISGSHKIVPDIYTQ